MFDQSERQLSQCSDLLLIHPPNQTDSFVLFIKSTMLLSKVKNFNLRIRAKYFAQDPSLPQAYPLSDIRFDPRDTPEFGAMSSLALAFTDSLPTRYKDAMPNGTVDPLIYSTLMAPSMYVFVISTILIWSHSSESVHSYYCTNHMQWSAKTAAFPRTISLLPHAPSPILFT